MNFLKNIRKWSNVWQRVRDCARRGRYHLSMEQLEDRMTPATYLVTSTADFGDGSLRDIIDNKATKAGDIVKFNIGAGVQTIQLKSTLNINTEIILDGAAPAGKPTQVIEINGAKFQGNGDGISVNAKSVIESVTIDGFQNGVGLDIRADDSTVFRCQIGTDVIGMVAKPNKIGLEINAARVDVGFYVVADEQVIRGRNTISGNIDDGVLITSRGSAAAIKGNWIGLAADGKTPIGNGEGIHIDGNVQGITIGVGDDDGAWARNVISGNRGNGIFFDVSSIPNKGFPNKVTGNYIGTDSRGQFAVLNQGDGIYVKRSTGVIIGGGLNPSQPLLRNIISGNARNGIELKDSQGIIVNNAIGVDRLGNTLRDSSGKPVGNQGSGIKVDGVDATDGGVKIGDVDNGNVISGNRRYGILIENAISPRNNLTSVSILGNEIGTSFNGATSKDGLGNSLGNVLDGIFIDGSDDGVIGDQAAPNIISGNGGDGIGMVSTIHFVVRGNLIGVNKAGTRALGNGESGVLIGTRASENEFRGNLISGNSLYGINVRGSGNQIIANTFGTGITPNVKLPNKAGAIHEGKKAVLNTLENNVIGFGPGGGVLVGDSLADAGAVEDSILSNTFIPFGVQGLAIDLGSDGVTPNHPGGPLHGPNQLQNRPVLSSAISLGPTTFLSGSLESSPNSTFVIQVYDGEVVGPQGVGLGQSYLEQVSVNTDSSGHATYTISVPTSLVPFGSYLSATATDSNGNTSEFSQAQRVQALNLYNTGTDATNTATDQGATDTHYTVTSFIPDPGQPPATVGPATYTEYNSRYIADTTTSNWITASPDAYSIDPVGTYTWTTTVVIPSGINPKTLVVSGRWSTDNEGVDILVNGVSSGNAIPNTLSYQSWADFTLSGPWHAGTNTISFVVHNDLNGPGLANPAGLRVEFTGIDSNGPAAPVAPVSSDSGAGPALAAVGALTSTSLAGFSENIPTQLSRPSPVVPESAAAHRVSVAFTQLGSDWKRLAPTDHLSDAVTDAFWDRPFATM